jgi:hypothetical protein
VYSIKKEIGRLNVSAGCRVYQWLLLICFSNHGFTLVFWTCLASRQRSARMEQLTDCNCRKQLKERC